MHRNKIKMYCSFFFLVFPLMAFATLETECFERLSQYPGSFDQKKLVEICKKMELLPDCVSQSSSKPIFHFDKIGKDEKNPYTTRILVFSQFHGDEFPAGSVARHWLERMLKISTRNTWRIVPEVNPDGILAKTRTNGRGVDLNRNLPTKNWSSESLQRWTAVEKKNPRRFPGEKENSESESRCVLKHIDDFKPQIIVSLHTPYGLLDFDGPKEIIPKNGKMLDIPWKSLGHYPGSLGRYMWAERNVPVLTIELKGNELYQTEKYLNLLQDTIGDISIRLITHQNKQSMISSARNVETKETTHVKRIPTNSP